MSRDDGFAAMATEAKQLREGKAPKEHGSVMLMEDCHRARIQWREPGEMRYAYGPRRAEMRRAEEDLEACERHRLAKRIQRVFLFLWDLSCI